MKTPPPRPTAVRRRALAVALAALLALGGSVGATAPAFADETPGVEAVASERPAESGAGGAVDAAAGADPAAEDAAPAPAETASEPAGEQPGPEASVTPNSGTAPVAPSAEPAATGAAEPASAVAAPSLQVTPADGVDPAVSNTFTISGTGYLGAGARFGTYVLLGDAGIWHGEGPLVAAGWLALAWVQPTAIVDGAFTTTVTVPAGSFDAKGSYVVATSAAHGLSATDRSLDAFAPITIAQPLPVPAVTVSKTADLDPKGETVTVRGTGFVPNPPATNGVRPPLAGRFAGAYVVFGSFADAWRPSEGAASGTRVVDSQRWVVDAADVASIGGAAAGAVAVAADGSFELELTVREFEKALADGNYGVYTYAGSGAKVAAFETYTPVEFAKAPEPVKPALTVSPSTDVDGSVANTFRISGTGYTGPGAAYGAYVMLGDASIWSGDGPLVASGWAALAWVRPAQIVDGAFSLELQVPAGALDPAKRYTVATSAAHQLSATDRSLDAFAPITVKAGGTTPKPTPTPTPTPGPVDPGTTAPVASGSLSWGVSSAFRGYITTIAAGSITVGSGATQSGGAFQFGQSGGSFDAAAGTGTADYAGSVRFTGHGGILDLTLSNPTLRVTGPTSAVLVLSANGSRVDFATVDLGAAAKSTTGGATRFAGAPATLTAAGAAAFQGYYPAGKALDPITAVIGSPGAAPAGSTGTIATAAPAAASKPVPLAPPATTGIDLDPAVLADLAAGKPVTISVGGFAPNETGIRVVVYSTPTVLADNLTADANGVVTWTGALPAGLEPGQHTLTFQGSISKGVVFTLAAAAGMCAVSEASLDWGFKSRFLQYLEGGIANGGWTVTGASDTGDGFAFAGGAGSIDGASVRGVVAFPGTIEFTGHGGALDTTIANPKLEFASADEAYLLLDVTGTTQQGEAVVAQGMRFAALELDGALQRDGDHLVGTEVPAAFTEQGAAAFGTYAAGEALDPVSFTVVLPADCGLEAAPAAKPVADTDDVDAEASAASTAGPMPWLVWAGIALVVLLLGAAVAIVLIRRGRRSA